MPPGEAGRMGAPAPRLAVPQPEFPAAGSPPRTVQMPDPAVPREAPPVVPTGPEEPVVPGGMQGATPTGRTTAGERAGEDAAQEAAVAGPRDISELLAQALEEYRRTAVRSGGAAPEGADAGELIAQALAAVAPRTEGAKERSTEAVSSGGQDAGRGVPKAQTPAGGGGVVEPSGGRAKGKEWRSGCGSGGSGARWHPVSRVRRGWRTAWISMRAPAGPGCPPTCGHGWTRRRRQGAEALTSGLWRPSRRGRTRRRRWSRLETGRRGAGGGGSGGRGGIRARRVGAGPHV